MIEAHDIDLHRTSILLPLADTVSHKPNTFRRFVWGKAAAFIRFCASQAIQIVNLVYVLFTAHFPHNTTPTYQQKHYSSLTAAADTHPYQWDGWLDKIRRELHTRQRLCLWLWCGRRFSIVLILHTETLSCIGLVLLSIKPKAFILRCKRGRIARVHTFWCAFVCMNLRA